MYNKANSFYYHFLLTDLLISKFHAYIIFIKVSRCNRISYNNNKSK